MSIPHNASKSCRNLTVIQLQQKSFYSIDPGRIFNQSSWLSAGVYLHSNVKM